MGIVVDKIRELMKKLVLLLITLITFANVSYASFPIKKENQSEISIILESKNDPWYKTNLFKISLALLGLIIFSIDSNIGSLILTAIVLYYLIGFIKRLINWDFTPYSLWSRSYKRGFWIGISVSVLILSLLGMLFSGGPMM